MAALQDHYVHRLSLSPHNPRRVEPTTEEIEALARSIMTLGLLQNLIGYDAGDGTIEITGGGRRLRAITHLSDTGQLPETYTVPVMVYDEEKAAIEAGIAENEARRNMNPVEQLHAFITVRDKNGLRHDQIADAFGCDETRVHHVLALEAASPAVLAALESEKLTLDQARAFTITTDHEAQNAVLTGLLQSGNHSGWMGEPRRIRSELRARTSAETLAVKYSQLPEGVYEASGGTITTDLFCGAVKVDNPEILNRCFDAWVKAKADALRADGWSWVEVMTPPMVDGKAIRIHGERYTLTDDEQARLDTLEEKDEEEMTDADRAEYEKLVALFDLDVFSEDQKSVAGVVIGAATNGYLNTIRGIIKPEDKARAIELGVIDGPGQPGSASGPDEGGKDPYSATLRQDLMALATVFTAEAVARKPEFALDLLAWNATVQGWKAPVAIRGSAGTLDASGLGVTATFEEVEQSYEPLSFADFRKLGKAHRNSVLARWVAGALNGASDLLAEAATAGAPELREDWTPNALFFNRLPAGTLDAIYRSLTGTSHTLADAVKALDEVKAPKKADMVKHLARVFEGASAYEQELHRIGWAPAPDFAKRVLLWLPDPLAQGDEDEDEDAIADAAGEDLDPDDRFADEHDELEPVDA